MSDEEFSHPVFKTREEFDWRMAQVLAQEREPGWWYLSFVDPDLPEGQRWLGGCFVEASGVLSAAMVASARGCNPGGEVAGLGPMDIPPREGYAYRLLNKEELEEANHER